MNVFEVEQKQTVTREEAVSRLRTLANMLAGHDEEIEFDRGGLKFKLHVPDEIQLKVELEVDSDERELEIELKW